MLTGDELRAARESGGLTQQQLGDAIEVSMRTVGNWERSPRVPAPAERRVRRAFPDWFGERGVPLSSVSDAQLLAEIARRFDRGRQERDGDGDAAPNRQPPGDGSSGGVVHMPDLTPPLDVAADEGEPQPGFDSQDPDDRSDERG